jgi:signal transduction histidine kinase
MVLYRVVQEGLTNVARHARARRVDVRLSEEPATESLVLQISDDGVGAAPGRARAGVGLSGMRERVESLGGVFEATTPPHGGFRIVARLPIATASA